MSGYLVTAINGTTARFFTLESVESAEYETGPTKLVEHEGILSSAKELSGEALWASTKTGRNRGASGQNHTYDDHRQNHMVEFERRFAQAVTTQLLNLVQTHQTRQLVLIAEPQILGVMREFLTPKVPKNVQVNELARDLCHLKPHELHGYLADKGKLPARVRGD